MELKELDKALIYLNKALNTANETGDKRLIGNIYRNIGIAKEEKGNLNEALKLYYKAQKLFTEINEVNGLTRNTVNISTNYLKQNMFDSAFVIINRGIEIALKDENKKELTELYHNLGEYYALKNNKNKAAENYNKSLKYGEEMGIIKIRQQTYKVLSDLYYNFMEYEKALEYHKKYLAAKDTVFNRKNTNNLLNSK